MNQPSDEYKIAINYIEFNVKDIQQSKIFYQSLGWTFTDFGPAYCKFDSGAIKGGFAQADHVHSAGGALVVLYTEQIEQSLQCVKDAGGTIVQEIFSFPGGRRFHFKDLDGYELAVWSH
ncbi:VOC family protein [Acinetobacter sp.]|uniref:VOC family protein n=1 Tax=Acinetobacter sp. TaxID=472 RepID=UPI0025907734|nr:VOC family protein [Acinetobacter sp.]